MKSRAIKSTCIVLTCIGVSFSPVCDCYASMHYDYDCVARDEPPDHAPNCVTLTEEWTTYKSCQYLHPHPDLWYCVDLDPGTATHHRKNGTPSPYNVSTHCDLIWHDDGPPDWVCDDPGDNGQPCSYHYFIGPDPFDPSMGVWYVYDVTWSSDITSSVSAPSCYILVLQE